MLPAKLKDDAHLTSAQVVNTSTMPSPLLSSPKSKVTSHARAIHTRLLAMDLYL
jgi:hypothetical protein